MKSVFVFAAVLMMGGCAVQGQMPRKPASVWNMTDAQPCTEFQQHTVITTDPPQDACPPAPAQPQSKTNEGYDIWPIRQNIYNDPAPSLSCAPHCDIEVKTLTRRDQSCIKAFSDLWPGTEAEKKQQISARCVRKTRELWLSGKLIGTVKGLE